MELVNDIIFLFFFLAPQYAQQVAAPDLDLDPSPQNHFGAKIANSGPMSFLNFLLRICVVVID